MKTMLGDAANVAENNAKKARYAVENNFMG